MTPTTSRRLAPAKRVLDMDGLVARPSQGYALEKLFYIDRYMDMFATATSRSFKFRCYVDLLAGPGRIEVGGIHYPGSPVLSADSPFTHRVFVEADPELASALKQRVDPACVIEGDSNSSGVINRLRDKIEGPDMISLIFVDNLGTDVLFETIRRLTDDRDVDLMIVHQVSDITRNVKAAFHGEHSQERFDQYFGSTQWRSVISPLIDRNASPEAMSGALLEHYRIRLATLGYDHSSATATIRNSRHAAQYRVLLASRHPLGEQLFKKAAEIDPYGQRTLGLV